MKTQTKLVALKESSYNVVFLHKALEVLGLKVSQNEVKQHKAGEDTKKKVRALQSQFNVPIDDSTLVDENTLIAIEEALAKRGLTTASKSFTVSGTVRLQDGSVMKRQRLMSFDLDLQGVAIYRSTKTLSEIKKSSAFEFLGETSTDNRGQYEFSFYDWQYRRAEFNKATIVVYALGGKEDSQIIGCSRLINSEDYSGKGFIRELDLIITMTDSRTEYDKLMGSLSEFFVEKGTSLAEISKSGEQLAFAAAELDLDSKQVNFAAAAELMVEKAEDRLSHELLYGIGRQGISLGWSFLYKKSKDELHAALEKSIKERIINKYDEEVITSFLEFLREHAVRKLLEYKDAAGNNKLNQMLSNALPEKAQRISFLKAVGTFKGNDYRVFWNEYLPAQPEFRENPSLISGLLLTQQLTLLTGGHQALVDELQVQRKIDSLESLLDLEVGDWMGTLQKTGVPEYVQGKDKEEKLRTYVGLLQAMLNAALPTQRIVRMIKDDKLPIRENVVSIGIKRFLAENKNFDFAVSRVHDYDKELERAAGEHFTKVKDELLKIQRTFQVSTSPEAMAVLLKNNLHSARSIADIPFSSFIKNYAMVLGGEETAIAIKQRAEHIANRAEFTAMHLMEYTNGFLPASIVNRADFVSAKDAIQTQIPNYSELFGSPDICECEQCRSVYGAAAYLVELLRFLNNSGQNSQGESPLDILKKRRPDLPYLKLTCENTNTNIPYIDLANEVMEFYTANDSLNNFQGYDTGKATSEELRANPQNLDNEAYRKLKDVKYPFTLPYHQPLDAIRAYGDHFKVSRYTAMKVMNPLPDARTKNAIAAEALRLSEEEYKILTGITFNGDADTTALHEYFGYAFPDDIENMSVVPEFLRRSGISYTDLVDLIETNFINPYKYTFDFLTRIFTHAPIDASTLYARLNQIEAGTLDPAADVDIMAALNSHNISAVDFTQWVKTHLVEFRQVITLFEPESKCDLETTKLLTLESIYTNSITSGIQEGIWSKVHRLIRLWHKLGWTLHETDLMLAALGENNITVTTIAKLEFVSLLVSATKSPLSQLAVLWGKIDTYGDKSLYKKLFLNKAIQQIDPIFKDDPWGNYLQNATETLVNHRSSILSAFRIREEDLDAIVGVTKVRDNGNPRPLNLGSDVVNLPNLSTIYRYVVLAKALKMRVVDLCKLIAMFGMSPFSIWDIQQEEFANVAPDATYSFYKLADSTKMMGFRTSVLEYILLGTLPADSRLGLDRNKALQAVKAIREGFSSIEQNYPTIPPSTLTLESLAAKLALTFQPEVVSRFVGILDGTISFQTKTDANLSIVIPDELAQKYTYVKGSGRLTCVGIMSDNELATLNGFGNPNFKRAVNALYSAPADFISVNFSGIFTDIAETSIKLFDHPAQLPTATLEEKLSYVYSCFIPILKEKLRRDAIIQHIASLIGLSEAATSVLIAKDVNSLIDVLEAKGFSANYFCDATWTKLALPKEDETIDFSWGTAAPDPMVPADNFSSRWEAYIAAPASGDYTLQVDVAEADEVLKLYLDDMLILEKTDADTAISWEILANLNAAQLHLLKLEYAEKSQNASVRLLWKTATLAPEVIPASVAFPAGRINSFLELTAIYHRAAKFISGFTLSEAELKNFIEYKADFANINFKQLTVGDWQRISNYATLRRAVPQAQAFLIDLFGTANITNPAPSLAEMKALLYSITAWDKASLEYLVDTHFKLDVPDFKNEIALNRICEIMQIVAKTGLTAQTIAHWGNAETDFDFLNDTAQLLKNTIKAKYEDADWLQLAGELSNTIRKNQQQALISYLLTKPNIQGAGVRDADGLFEHFLIDVQMGACMDTSRIVQANASIQMFVNRCLLNLESEKSSGTEKGVSPDAIDKNRWEWMKNYRVWEANRKVFLYPENLLNPEWREDRSEFFKELESYLVQNDITEHSVEQAFRNYLASLNEVANLDVCGLHRENYDDGKLKYLHVFARTHNAPYKYFYRRWNKYQKWSAWERVPLDIQSVDDGSFSGVHLIPTVWKNRLFLFWPEFIEAKEDSPSQDKNQSIEKIGKNSTIAMLEPRKSWDVRLAWSEYVFGKWTPKQVTKEFLQSRSETHPDARLCDFRFQVITGQDFLNIFFNEEIYGYIQWFTLSDIQSKIETWEVDWGGDYHVTLSDKYFNYFMKRAGDSNLELMGDTYLQKFLLHQLTFPDNSLEYPEEHILNTPFFYTGTNRSYFIHPVDITVIEVLKNVGCYKPYLPELVDDSGFNTPFKIPVGKIPVGPDDYVPTPILRPRFTSHLVLNSRRMDSRVHLPEDHSYTSFSINPVLTSLSEMKQYTYLPPSSQRRSSIMEHAYTPHAFGNILVGPHYSPVEVKPDIGLEFHTFYHPKSGEYVERLNRGGLPGLMDSDTVIASDDGKLFEDVYDPNFNQGFVQKPTDFDRRTYYKENICFDMYGANSLYNWELFFHAPLYIATRLSKNGKYTEAMKWFHYIFDPTTDEMPTAGESETSRYWKVLPFKTEPKKKLEDYFRDLNNETDPTSPNYNPNSIFFSIVDEWRDNPFKPHLVAAGRPLAYMKYVVLKYVENLIAWGDSLFRQFQRESVNEALQIYVIANHILGPRPEFVPKRGEIKAESYGSLENKWDAFSNALVELENIFPYSSKVSISSSSPGTSLLGVGSALYFCIPPSEKLIDYWNTVADRLYKIRHCQDIDGVERKLALFSPPIEPGLLIQAASQGLSLGSILADISSPPPIYRFTHLIQKANEFCSDVKALGSALLATLEKKDAEELSRLRASHETQMFELMTAIKERQVLDAKVNKQNLEKARKAAEFRLKHYLDLLGNDSVTPPPMPTISATLTADSQLPADTSISIVKTDVDESLVNSDESGIKLIQKELQSLQKANDAKWWQTGAGSADTLAGILNMIVQGSADGKPFGVGAGVVWGGINLGTASSAAASGLRTMGQFVAAEGSQSATVATYIRREQDWTLQANLVAREIIQLDKQITSADIRIQVAEKELENHRQQIENAKQIELFLKDKFTNQELYQWMKEQLFAVYKDSYNLAFDMAKKAEKAYKYEIGTEMASSIQYGYWDNSKQGLVAGEKLQLALRQMEKSYLEQNRRELELTKSISLARLDPLALIELRETGKCYVSVPEELFDLDFRGHYYRRIKSVRITIPCVAGPYTSVSCTLRLLNNSVRINTSIDPQYEHNNDDGLIIDDDRFHTNYTPVTSIATSSAQNDSGTFELNFRDERYLPFELAGAISEWQLELSTDKDLRPFDYSTISDIVLHLNYTARESGGLFKEKASSYIKNFLKNTADFTEQPLNQMFSMRHDFPTEWHKFLHPSVIGAEQILEFTLGKGRFPFFVHDRDIVVMKIEVFAKCTEIASYDTQLSYFRFDDDPTIDIPLTSNPIPMPQSDTYGGLNKATIGVADAGLNLDEIDIEKKVSLKLKRSVVNNYASLATDPAEVKDIFIVVYYNLQDKKN